MRAYEIGLYEKAMPDVSWEEKLRAAKEAGYDFVEISIDASEDKIGRVYMPKAERNAALNAFDLGEVQVVCNVGVLTEGWDCTSVDCMVMP